MRNWRIISTIAAVVFATLAGVLVWKYLTNADHRAEAKKDLVPVLVAKNKIARGTVFDAIVTDKLYEQKDVPKDSLAPGQIEPASADQLLNLYKGKVAATDIFAGTPLVSEQFVQSSQLVSTVAGAIPKGKEAITVNLDQTHAVGGFVTPGDEVNVLVHLPVTGSDGNQSQVTRVPDPRREGDRSRRFDGAADQRHDRAAGRDRRQHDDDAAAGPADQPHHAAGHTAPGRADRPRRGDGLDLAEPEPAGLHRRRLQEPRGDRGASSTCSTSRSTRRSAEAACSRTCRQPPTWPSEIGPSETRPNEIDKERGLPREATVMENTSPTTRAGAQRYRVLAVEPDERMRTRMTLELAGIVPVPAASYDEVTREIVPGEATVVVFGPSLAGQNGFDAAQRLSRTFPEAGVVLLAEELTLPLLQEALRSGVRDAVDDRRG